MTSAQTGAVDGSRSQARCLSRFGELADVGTQKCTGIQQDGIIASRRYTDIHFARISEQHYAALIRVRAF